MKPSILRIIPSRWASRLATSVVALAFFTIFFSARNACAQTGGTSSDTAITWPHTVTLGFGGAANANWQISGTAGTSAGTNVNPYGEYGYTKSTLQFEPEFHIMAEIPLWTNWMLAPRISYNNYSLAWNNASSISPTNSTVPNPAVPLSLSMDYIGLDALIKYSFSGLHVMGGINFSAPIKAVTYKSGDSSGTLLNYSGLVAAIKVGVGFDIPVNAGSTIWMTPEIFFTYPLAPFASNNGFDVDPATVSFGVTMKFAVASAPPPPPPPPVPISATITAHGVMPDGSPVNDLVSPQQATHNRSSVPLLPYVFFDEGSAVIPSRYSQNGATGFSEESALAGKNALDANHEILDVIGSRMKNNPSMTITLTGTNSNTREEKNNIELSKARATAVASYIENTWGIDPSRITIDQRNLPEIPTNPVTKAGMAENRRVEITANDAGLTAPVKIENRQNVSVGATSVLYNTTVSPDPSKHAYKSWTIALDKDGVPLGQPLSGSGAPPATTTEDIPNAQQYVDQPVHYTLTVTDTSGQTAKADGLTRIEAKTVDHNNLEKYAMLSFDFDRADINPHARQMLDLIGESINAGATGVKIDGYCDSTGTPEYNQTLSEARANGAIIALRSTTSLPANVTAQGHGINDPKFPNDLPEGRQLNRRVEFTIEKSGQ
jgi:outer membrane protein OmpA-like peptidoglycan-associated protein